MAGKRDKTRRRRRRRASRERPVELRVTVPGWRPVPRRARLVARPLVALVRALPHHEPGRRGRRRANLQRLVIGGLALLLVTLGREVIALGVLGALVALSLFVLPVADFRKRRWIAAAEGLRRPRQVSAPRPATLSYDGAKLTIVADDRTWRSARPRQERRQVEVGVETDRVYLGLTKAGGKRGDQLWFVAPRPDLPETYDPLASTRGWSLDRVRDPIQLAGADWATLHELLWDPTTGGLPRPPGPARG